MSKRNVVTCSVHVAVAAAGALFLAPALGQDRISGGFLFEFQTDSVISADSAESEETSSAVIIEPGFGVPIAPGVSLNVGFVMEEWEFASDENDFNVSELFLEWSGDALSAHVGKIKPAFGIAWDVAPGIYGADFAGDYEIVGQLGAGIVVPFGGEEGAISVSIELFKEDTTALSSCAMDDRCGRIRREDGGPANTSGLSSFSATLGAESLAAMGGLGFQVGVLRRGASEGDPEDEMGFAAAVSSAVELDDGSAVEWMLESAHMGHFEAGTDDVTYLTAGVAYVSGPWNVALATSFRNTDPDEGDSVEDSLFQVSAGYAFDSGFSIDVGGRYGDEEEEKSRTIGVLLAYEAEF